MDIQQNENRSQFFQTKIQLETQAKNAAKWFYWIGGFSLFNTLMYIFGVSLLFVIGLGMTQVVDGVVSYFVEEMEGNAAVLMQVLGFVLNVVIVGVFAIFGYFAGKKKLWAYYAGFTLYALDSILMLLIQDWIGLAFHAFVLFVISKGPSAVKKLNAIEEKEGISETEAMQRVAEIETEAKAKAGKRFFIFVIVTSSLSVLLILFLIFLVQNY